MTTRHGLGRLPQFDERSRRFNVRSLVEALPPVLRSYTWYVPTHLDQLDTPRCVGYGFTHELLAKPTPVYGLDAAYANDVYRDAQVVDEYPGPPPDYDGTSVLAGARVMRARGHYREYRWAFSEPDLAAVVGLHGPVPIGVNWYTGMFTPDALGRIRPTGVVEGGHCVLVHGFNVKRSLYKIWQSWGPTWGIDGVAYISRDDMTRLLAEDGEACVPIRQKILVPAPHPVM